MRSHSQFLSFRPAQDSIHTIPISTHCSLLIPISVKWHLRVFNSWPSRCSYRRNIISLSVRFLFRSRSRRSVCCHRFVWEKEIGKNMKLLYRLRAIDCVSCSWYVYGSTLYHSVACAMSIESTIDDVTRWINTWMMYQSERENKTKTLASALPVSSSDIRMDRIVLWNVEIEWTHRFTSTSTHIGDDYKRTLTSRLGTRHVHVFNHNTTNTTFVRLNLDSGFGTKQNVLKIFFNVLVSNTIFSSPTNQFDETNHNIGISNLLF